MEILICVLLGAIQGLTEFLPVSSSGHLALAEQLLGLKPRLYLAAALHLATLGVVLVYFRAEIREILSDLGKGWRSYRGGTPLSDLLSRQGGVRTTALVITASVPTAAIGLTMESVWVKAAGSTLMVSSALLITAVFLWITRYRSESTVRIGFGAALVIGLAQGIAVTPGISRSGATIAAALLLGADRKEAGTFSFLIAVPAILGACILEGRQMIEIPVTFLPSMALGMAVSAIVGYLALGLLLRTVTKGRMHWYTMYLVPLGLAGLGYGLFGR